MISSFDSTKTEKVWTGTRSRKLPNEIQKIARLKLRMLNNSIDVTDLKIPPSNQLEKLSGNLNGFYRIRINKKWSIIFNWNNGNSSNVEIIEYH